MKKIFLAAFLSSLLFAGATNAMTVKPGDTLWKLFGKNWQTIATQNGITDPTKLRAGQTLNVQGDLLGSTNYVQTQYFTLYGSGAAAGATSIVLTKFVNIDQTLLTMADFGTQGFATIEPNNGLQEEQVAFTGVTQNANGTATLTGVTTVLNKYPYTQTSGLKTTHPGGAKFVISNTSGFYNTFANQTNTSTITGLWTFYTYPQFNTSTQVPVSNGQFATKFYVDTVGAGGFTAANVSTTRGLSVDGSSPERVGINASSTTGLAFDSSGKLYQKVSSTAGLASDVNGIYINTTTLLNANWATTTPTAGQVPIANINGKIDSWITTSTVSFGTTTVSNKIASSFPYLLNVSTTAITVSSASLISEQTVVSTTIPTSTLGTNNIIRFTLYGSYTNDANVLTRTLRVKYNGTTLGTFALAASKSGGGKIELLLFAVNSASVQQSFISANMGNDPALSSVGTAGSATENSANSLPIVVTMQYQAAGGGNSFTMNNFTTEVLK